MVRYHTGENILVGDIIRVLVDKYYYGVVEQVMLPNTQEAKEGGSLVVLSNFIFVV